MAAASEATAAASMAATSEATAAAAVTSAADSSTTVATAATAAAATLRTTVRVSSLRARRGKRHQGQQNVGSHRFDCKKWDRRSHTHTLVHTLYLAHTHTQ